MHTTGLSAILRPPAAWLLMLLGAALTTGTTLAQTIRYVTTGGTNNYPATATTWATATADLQGTINASSAGDQVWVAAGTYKPGGTTNESNEALAFTMKEGVAIYGGFKGGEGSLGQRPAVNPVAGQTSGSILTGDLGFRDQQVGGRIYYRSFHVFFNPQGLTERSVLDGFVITRGDATNNLATNSQKSGGGMYNEGSSPTLQNLVFQDNSGLLGGGLSNVSSSPVLINCLFQQNSASSFSDGGGALRNNNSTVRLENCLLQNNRSGGAGGAIFNTGNSKLDVIQCTLQNNDANSGGAIANYGSSLLLFRSMLQTNRAVFEGGALANNGSISSTITNCLLQGNSAPKGSGIYNKGSVAVLTNCTLRANRASISFDPNFYPGAGAVYNEDDASANLSSCIVFGNWSGYSVAGECETRPGRPPVPCNIIVTSYTFRGSNTLRYTMVDDTTARQANYTNGVGNLTTSVSPFVSDGDSRLTNCTPAINAGDPATNSLIAIVGTRDLSNESRFYNGSRIDMGAYEFQGTPAFAITSQPPSGSVVCQGASVAATITTTGTSPLTYQWYKDGQVLNPPQNTATLTFNSVTTANSGNYLVVVTGSCGSFTSTAFSLTVNPAPTVSINPSATAVCAGQSATFTATPGLATYRWSPPNGGPTLTTASISVSVAGTYSLTVTNASSCTATAQASLTVNPLPTPTITGLTSSICQEASPVLLTGTGNPSGGVFTIDGLTATTFNPASLSVGQHTVVYSFTNTNDCSNTTSQMVTIKATPTTPTIATQSGHAYPAGLSSLTISQNTGNVVLTASGCMGGTLTWAGGNNTTLAVSTMNTGTQTFTATCQTNGCTSPIATAGVTVAGTTLSVLHRDGNGNVSTTTLAPYLQLQNDGNTAIPYSEITVRYWLTVENYSPLLFSINYAQLGNDKVHLRYVPAPGTGNPKATGYIEFSFDAAAGSLAPISNSGPIQDLINKQDYSYFDQSNDYSYAPVGNFTSNERITAYRNGIIFYGVEPGPVVATQSVKAMLQNNTGADANTIEAVLSVTNDGNVPVNYGDLKVRYYFTADGNQPLVLSQVGYTALGSSNVTARLVTISPALAGADTYLELSFSAGLGQLAPGASTGGVTYQLRHADYSGFNQANDYSYQGTGGMMLSSHVVVFVAGQRVWGNEPGAGGRLSAELVEVPLQVRVLGNPVAGSTIEVQVRGAEGQPLRLQLTDVQGRAVSERQIDQASAVDRQTLSLGQQPAGLLLLWVSTPTQSQTVKVLKTD